MKKTGQNKKSDSAPSLLCLHRKAEYQNLVYSLF